MISQYIGLSPRYLNSLFAEESTSLMRYVWQRRLTQCRKDLVNPVCTGQRLHQIAFRWGFNNAAHFSRAFKQQFGVTPSDFLRLSKRK